MPGSTPEEAALSSGTDVTASYSVKAWAVAALKATSAVTAKVGGSLYVRSWDDDVPSAVGVYVGLVTHERDEYSRADVGLRVRCVAVGEAACHALARAIQDALAYEPNDFSLAPAAAPSGSSLRLHRCGFVSLDPPARDGPGGDTYAATVTFRARAKPVDP